MLFLNKKNNVLIMWLFLFFIIVTPILSFAVNLIPCDGKTNPCDFNDFITLINNIINWIISMSVVIFTFSAVWGGFLYVTSGANPGNKQKAINILWSTLFGFVIILIAWLIVYTIVSNLTPDNSPALQFIK